MGTINCVLVGGGTLLIQCADVLAARGFQIVAVVTSNPQVQKWSSESGISVLNADDDYAHALSNLTYDWLFSIANLRLLPEAVWRNARLGAANFHDGPLPQMAGLNTPAWAIIEGHKDHGVTWHAITQGIDEGDIYAQTLLAINDDETALTLNTKCLDAGISTFATLLDHIEHDDLKPRRQDFSTRAYYEKQKRPTAAATLDFAKPAKELSQLVRGLDFGDAYENPLAKPKLRFGSSVYTISHFRILDAEMEAEPGLVLSVGAHGVTVGTADKPVLLDAEQKNASIQTKLSSVVYPGDRLPLLDQSETPALDDAVARCARHEGVFRRALEGRIDVQLPIGELASEQRPDVRAIPLNIPDHIAKQDRAALVAALLLRQTGQRSFDIAYADDALDDLCQRHPGYFAEALPLRMDLGTLQNADELVAHVNQTMVRLRTCQAYCSDLVDRIPGLQKSPLAVGIREMRNEVSKDMIEGCALTFAFGENGSDLMFDRKRIDEAQARSLASAFNVLASAFATTCNVLEDLPLMSAADENTVLYGWNDTGRSYDKTTCIHTLIEAQVDRTPDAEAVAFRGRSLTYRQLDEQANCLAKALVAEGVGPDVTVGLYLPRSLELVVGALAIMKAGGAYIPLDPSFPADRLAFMIKDSRAKLVLTAGGLRTSSLLSDVRFLCVNDILRNPKGTGRLAGNVKPKNLAYVIYTSGSTGLPKGVMIEHRNVVNFFVGMDERVGKMEDTQNVWLAVTSLSFDISVLELFWTLARGFKVVIHASEVLEAKTAGKRGARPTDLGFGLFYWGNDGAAGPEKYRLLLEGAKFADANGFDALWTPERHFHAFGGPYPNPAVTGAAVAAVTSNLSIRAGSCVLPLHHPARVAEEWAVIDNLSNGRVALAFASGWMPEDFVLRPENAPPRNKASLMRDIEVVRSLWRGESVEFDLGAGTVPVVTQPRPVQSELPVWLTTAGNPESYREAARHGANVLTHLLGQSIAELSEKIRVYRETLKETGRDPEDYKVTLMLHTLLGENRDAVRDLARAPMKEYLRSAAALIKQYAWAFPAFKKPHGVSNPMEIDLQSLDAEELEAILEFAFLRYFEDSGLFGTVEDALERLEEVKAAGVDEIACLIDFGLADDVVMARLPFLAEVVAASKSSAPDEPARSFADEVHKHKVTHLQCTPSMAHMFMMSDADRAALGQIRHLFLGGEALQGSLLAALRGATDAAIENMYGPTETTIWSSTFTANTPKPVVPIGRPIANTQMYVLDAGLRPVPPGNIGELFIGGDGVARGYFDREQLTRERFVANPFEAGRMYRTGDLARFDEEGVLHFLGRTDHQIKIRGHRIELGEIEARISAFAGVRETVVVPRKDGPGNLSLVAYLRTDGAPISDKDLRRHILETLPDVMVPSHFVTMDAFPLTPNAKVDRNRLPAPSEKNPTPIVSFIEPSNNLQREISTLFASALGLEKVGIFDNFFALGGHSLLAVQLHRELKAKLSPDLTITDLFRFPTVASLADHVSDRGKTDIQLTRAAERAALRRSAIERRPTLRLETEV
ncbi:LLM class flavin-dependent oxidoreductase [Rhizobium sp. NTR19]|uniref:LLM class flavin-dependent oxidoreductase n=1 Tax=Neorhizobium turbinariae TaxID=2937795 RepID=A0ABT0IX38_9HYPH|nr:MupA/Atu3671 family FMN-dependent luciferase-like monooxygenase [Neorhizobium turbinariae]MCK8782445.1 LLM class flavin-dependent oxidoreductase [Neorhizobium turbinariae]